MSSERRFAANRANARKSTGPSTEAGKARAAQNARRHGLTAPPEPQLVAHWYRLILDDPGAVPDPLELDPYLRAARDLAEAEAQLTRVRRAEEQYLLNPRGAPSEAEEELRAERELIRDWLKEAATERAHLYTRKKGPWTGYFRTPRQYRSWTGQGERLLLRIRAHTERAARKRLAAEARMGRTLARYRAAAEARRRKALRRWIEQIAKRTQRKP